MSILTWDLRDLRDSKTENRLTSPQRGSNGLKKTQMTHYGWTLKWSALSLGECITPLLIIYFETTNYFLQPISLFERDHE